MSKTEFKDEDIQLFYTEMKINNGQEGHQHKSVLVINFNGRFSAGSVVCQPRRKQQHPQPDPQLGAEDPIAACSYNATDHGHVPTVR